MRGPISLSERRATGEPEVLGLSLLEDVSHDVVHLETPEELCRHLLARLCAVVPAASGAIYLVEEGDRLMPVAVHGSEDIRQSRASQMMALRAMVSGDLAPTPSASPLVSREDFRGEPALVRPRRGARRQHGARVAAVPFRLDGAVLGVLVLSRAEEGPPFSAEELSFLKIVSLEVAFALDRARTRATLDEVERTRFATVNGLTIAIREKDEYTAGHLLRVTGYALAILDLIAPEHSRDPQFEFGFLLHDVGKLGVPDAVLKKPGPLSDAEREVMRLHPETGRRILEGIPFLGGASEIVYAHHERWDGNGYPRGLAGDDIPLGARVFPIADSFDAMTSDRPYRGAISIDDARNELAREAGGQFEPRALEAFLSLARDDLEAIRNRACHESASAIVRRDLPTMFCLADDAGLTRSNDVVELDPH